MPDHGYFANLIWQIADLLRGPYRPPQYERVMLPMTVLRRFDCVLAPTKAKVLAAHQRRARGRMKDKALDAVLNRVAGQRFHNRSPLDFERLQGDPDNIDKHLVSYIEGFSRNVRDIFEFFEFEGEIEKLREANILYMIVSRFRSVDLHPATVPNEQMGLIFENLIRRFNELANETAGDHFTPREVIRLMVNVLFIDDDALLSTPGTVRTLLDPACGTGGMLAEAQNYLRDHHAEARLYVHGQDYNKRAFATAASDMLMKQVDHNGKGDNVRFGDSLTDDAFDGRRFDYFLTNPPFGVDWKRQQKAIRRERDQRGFDGRFGAGLPRITDGSLLFLQHMIDKFERVAPAERKHGSRLAIVFSGSPLFTGGAGSGESDIRRWIIENDWLEAIIALPEQMFYNTGIGTYVWIVTNRKEKRRRGKIQLLDARQCYVPMRRSLGDKRRKLGEPGDGTRETPAPDHIAEIVRLYGAFADGDRSRVFDNEDFGYTRVTVERPLRLRYQMTFDDKTRFLDACPHLVDDVQAIDREIGREPQRDWNGVWSRIEDLLDRRESWWRMSEKRIFREVFPPTENREPGSDEWGVLKLNAVSRGRFDDTAAKALQPGLTPRTALTVHAGDFLVTRSNTPLLVGDVCFVESTRPRLMLSDLIYRLNLRLDRIGGRFLAYFLTLPVGRSQIEIDARGTSASMVKISQEHIKNWWIPVPPKTERQAIVRHLATETTRIDVARTATDRTISLLKERRGAMITAAVAGQIEVRSVA